MSTGKETITLLLADDHPVVRVGIRSVLKDTPDIQVVGEAPSDLEVRRMALELNPRVLLLDWHMLGPRLSELEEWMHASCPETVILTWTAHDRDAYLAHVIEMTAGYLVKDVPVEELVAAIRRAAQGEILFDAGQRARARRWRENVGKRWGRLTRRERQIAILIARGKADKFIAQELHIAAKTVSNHVGHMLRKLHVTSRTEAALWIVREGFADQANGLEEIAAVEMSSLRRKVHC